MSTQPQARRSAAEQAKFEAAVRRLTEERITFNQVLGLKLHEMLGPNGTVCRFAMRPELVGHYLYGRLHGGVTSAVLDATAGIALMVAIGEKFAHESADQVMHRFAKMGTIDMRIDYLRPGLGQYFDAQAVVTRLGGRIGSTQMRLVNDQGTLIATGAGAYVIA
ncbi:MAG: thioesterase family protein [Burkholderiales bacterium]|nr:thioesterase family protein [Burkholderiales bacterium]